MIFDSNVVIDLLDGTSPDSVAEFIGELLAENNACINEIIFAEVSSRYPSAQVALAQLRTLGLALRRLSPEDCHRAGMAFAQYRREGRERTTILPDFLIGAHAAGQGWPIVTRDRKGFATYFPEVDLIDPYTDHNRA